MSTTVLPVDGRSVALLSSARPQQINQRATSG